MRWSCLFIPTLREAPAEAESMSEKLLLRAGYIRRLSAGIYSNLLPAQRSLQKIQDIIRAELNAIHGQEMLLPLLNPAGGQRDAGSWKKQVNNRFRLKDGFGRDFYLGMTHEETIMAIARGELRSYKQLPQIWYQIQTQFRDEARPNSGLLCMRQFTTADSYSIDMDAAALDLAYQKHFRALCAIFDRCGLTYTAVEGASDAIGGGLSHEFMMASDAGEDFMVTCRACGYAANLKKAISKTAEPVIPDPEGERAPEEFHTPGFKTIAELTAFTKLPETSQMKSFVVIADETPVLVMVRGDHQVNETKLATVLRARELRPAQAAEIISLFGASAGSLGPVGVKNMRVLADVALAGRRNMIAGANKDDYHLRYVTPGEDFMPEYFDLRQTSPGDHCDRCGAPLTISNAVELGHVLKVSHQYGESVGPRVLGENGKEFTPAIGAYRIWVERILACAVEQFHDQDGMGLPAAIAPFAVVISPVHFSDPTQRAAAERLYTEAREAGIDVLLDDREERPGVKFKDADLMGIPFRITLGKKLASNQVELCIAALEKRKIFR